ncbi:hypothetical protein RCH18_001897 [Flavobacterium sp. PL11]|jgi:hypothetical protein|uniref:hypothetical protein n=1 Tax=Flavobacterium sp. PL11 TaxID=3071717 RepID=UPI002DFA5AB8|nr:hypothetical protein [Flavobacterium sp. PL11]
MDEINYDEVYNQLMGFIDAITTKENVSKKDVKNLILKLERSINFDTSLLTGEEVDDLPF